MIELDGRELSGKLHWVDRGLSTMRWLRPAVPVALGIAGVLAVRRLKGTLSLAGKAVVGYQIARSFLRRASVAAPSKARD